MNNMTVEDEINIALRHMRIQANALKGTGVKFKQSINMLQYKTNQKTFWEWLRDSLKATMKQIKTKISLRSVKHAIGTILIVMCYGVSYKLPEVVIPNRNKFAMLDNVANDNQESP